jgi:hypothetical protein
VNKEPTDNCVEPKPGSKKDIVFQAGRTEEGGSIKTLSEQMGCTPSNVRQHIAQCHTKLGYGYNISGDNFKILGETTVAWADTEKAKAEEAAAKKAAKDAEKAAAEPDAPEDEEPAEDDGSDDDFLE